jgi:hypothetical protein
MSKATLICNFCGKSEHEVKHLVAANNVAICGDCAALAVEIVEGHGERKRRRDMLASLLDDCVGVPGSENEGILRTKLIEDLRAIFSDGEADPVWTWKDGERKVLPSIAPMPLSQRPRHEPQTNESSNMKWALEFASNVLEERGTDAALNALKQIRWMRSAEVAVLRPTHIAALKDALAKIYVFKSDPERDSVMDNLRDILLQAGVQA